MTKITQHTAGPWEANAAGLIYGHVGHDEDEAPFVCDVCVSPLEYTEAERANARLIAAAPELLEAADDRDLDEAHDLLSQLLEDPEAGNDVLRDAAITLCAVLNAHSEKRRSAIAKAKGGA
jgi:hypothetical protein